MTVEIIHYTSGETLFFENNATFVPKRGDVLTITTLDGRSDTKTTQWRVQRRLIEYKLLGVGVKVYVYPKES